MPFSRRFPLHPARACTPTSKRMHSGHKREKRVRFDIPLSLIIAHRMTRSPLITCACRTNTTVRTSGRERESVQSRFFSSFHFPFLQAHTWEEQEETSCPTKMSDSNSSDGARDGNISKDLAAAAAGPVAEAPAAAAGGEVPVDAASAASAGAGGKRELTICELIRLSIPVIPPQLGWALEEALLVPYLISIGVSEAAANVVWIVNPIASLLLSPMLGAASDRCKSRWYGTVWYGMVW